MFADGEGAQGALESVPHTIDGRQVDVKKAIPHQIHQVSNSCFN